jgi:hypothetical protein
MRIHRNILLLLTFAILVLIFTSWLGPNEVILTHIADNNHQSINIFRYTNVSCSPPMLNREYVSARGAIIQSQFEFVVLTSSDWKYRGVLLNWMAHMQHLKISNYIVICVDDKTHTLVGDWQNGGNGLYASGCTSSNKIFEIRHRVAEVLLTDNNLTVILSDADCIWLTDFYESWLSPHRYSVDIIAQMGKYPVHAFIKYGATACAGFVVVNPTSGGKRFYREYISRMTANQDDQMVLNTVLGDMNAFHFEERLSQTLHVPINDTVNLHMATPVSTGNVSSEPIQMALLPHMKFPRIVVEKHGIRTFQSFQDYMAHKPVVWHIAPPKGSAKGSSPRIYLLKATGMFVLDSKWVDVVRYDQLESYFRGLKFKYYNIKGVGVPVAR